MTEKKKKRMKFITSCRLCPFVISAAVSSSSCRCPSPPPAPFLLFSFFSHLPSLTIWLCVFSIYSPPHGMLGASNNEKARKPASTRRLYERFLLRDDYRRRLPQWTWRFTGYRQPGDEPPSPLPFPPFTWLVKIPLRVEIWIFGWIGAFGGILLIEAIMSTSTAFRDVYSSPIIITSFGASAVLLFGVIESPLAQPRNFIGGQFVSALVGLLLPDSGSSTHVTKIIWTILPFMAVLSSMGDFAWQPRS